MTASPGQPHFDHRAPGTAAICWAPLIAALPQQGAEVGPHDHLVVLAAHADDETLGAGGLLADAALAGAQITVIVASDGAASHPTSPTTTPAALAVIRRDEARAAVRRLAPDADLVLLGRPDGRLDTDPEGLFLAFSASSAGATVIATTWRGDGHPDHAACGDAAARLCTETGARLIEFPIWGWHWGDPGRTGPLRGERWCSRQLSGQAEQARALALNEYQSQVSPLSPAEGDEQVLGPELLEHFGRPLEVFRVGAAVDLPPAYFDRLYAADPDPWRVRQKFYEERKRDLLLAALPRPRFTRAFEPGCGIGLLTAQLATRCVAVHAMDASQHAVDLATAWTAPLDNVRVVLGSAPADWPTERFDLIIISELGYYLADVRALAQRARDSLTEDGVLVACHWRHPAPGYPSGAAEVHAALGSDLEHIAEHVEADFLLDVWSPDGRSVAQRDSVVS